MYKIFKQVIPEETLRFLQFWTLHTKELIKHHEGKPKANGSGIYWKGLDMASKFPLVSESENKKLFDVYTSKWMYDIVKHEIPTPHLFNDQIVVKQANENFDFQPHRDNDFGPFPGDESILTQNFTLVLDDFTEQNGALEVFESGKWYKLLPKAGDIIMIEGNTIHKSSPNKTDKPRRVYICHYSDRPIGEGFQKGFYSQPFKYN